MYQVADVYDYTTATEAGHPYPRPDHPVGFDSGITPVAGLLAYAGETPTSVIYQFNPGIVMDTNFTIGYAPWCANDVILTPEPMSLLLLGVGLMGIAGLRRKLEI